MKLVIALLAAVLLVGCGPAPAPVQQQQQTERTPDADGCVVDTSSELVTDHVVGPIRNLVKDKDDNGSCTVNFDITVDGKAYHLEETEDGLEQIESLCYYARERARKNLLLDIGGHFESKASFVCKHHDKN